MKMMKRIPPIPPVPPVSPENPVSSDKLADRVVRRNPEAYDGNLDPVELEDWIREMKNIFIVAKVLEEKRVSIRTFYLAHEADIR